MQQRAQFRLLDLRLERQQRTHLRVAVLLDHEHEAVGGEELLDLVAEREGLDPQVVERNALAAQHVERFAHGTVGAAEGDQRDLDARILLHQRCGHELPCGGELAQQPVEHDLVIGRVLGVGAELRVTRAAREVRALRVHAREGTIRNAVLVAVEVAVELLDLLQLRLAVDLAAVRLPAVVPLQVAAHPVVHADVEVRQHHHRCLQPFGEVERLHRHVEALLGVRGVQTDVFGVAMRSIGGGDEVALLGAGRHAGRGADALHVEHHGGDLGVVRQAQELAHQRDTRPGGRGEGAGAVPARAEHHADRREFVFGLDEREVAAAGLRIDAPLVGKALERIHQRGGRCDRVPPRHRGAGVDGAQAGRGVAVDHDVAGSEIHRLDAQRQRAGDVRLRVVVAELDRLHVRVDQRRLLRIGLGQQLADLPEIQIEQRRQRAGVADVLHQDARAHALEGFVAELRQRHADHGDVVAAQQRRARPGRVVEEIAARRHVAQVARIGLGVHRHHDVDLPGARHVAVLRDADLVPGRQALDVRREVVLAHHRDAAAEDRLHQQRVGARRAGSIDRGDLDHEIVDAGGSGRHGALFAWPQALLRLAAAVAEGWSAARGHLTVDFCMSQAAVGQRSAQSPQCTQTSSSFTITRPVCFSGALT